MDWPSLPAVRHLAPFLRQQPSPHLTTTEYTTKGALTPRKAWHQSTRSIHTSRSNNEAIMIISPAAPDLGGREHASSAAHVAERTLPGTLGSAALDTRDTRHGAPGSPRLGRGLNGREARGVGAALGWESRIRHQDGSKRETANRYVCTTVCCRTGKKNAASSHPRQISHGVGPARSSPQVKYFQSML